MTEQDGIKLLKAGFTVIRKDDYPQPRIKKMEPSKGIPGKDFVTSVVWKTLENYPSKAARDRAFAKMLEDERTITG